MLAVWEIRSGAGRTNAPPVFILLAFVVLTICFVHSPRSLSLSLSLSLSHPPSFSLPSLPPPPPLLRAAFSVAFLPPPARSFFAVIGMCQGHSVLGFNWHQQQLSHPPAKASVLSRQPLE